MGAEGNGNCRPCCQGPAVEQGISSYWASRAYCYIFRDFFQAGCQTQPFAKSWLNCSHRLVTGTRVWQQSMKNSREINWLYGVNNKEYCIFFICKLFALYQQTMLCTSSSLPPTPGEPVVKPLPAPCWSAPCSGTDPCSSALLEESQVLWHQGE